MSAEQVLKKKVNNSGREWYGYLTPVEIVFVVDVWKYKPNNKSDYKWAVDSIAKGESNPRYFYFTVDDPRRLQ